MQYLAESAPEAMPFTPKPPQGPRTLRFTIPAPHAGNSRDTSSWQGPRPPQSWSLKVSWPWKERSKPQTVLWVRWDCSLTDQPAEMLRFGGSRGVPWPAWRRVGTRNIRVRVVPGDSNYPSGQVSLNFGHFCPTLQFQPDLSTSLIIYFVWGFLFVCLLV